MHTLILSKFTPSVLRGAIECGISRLVLEKLLDVNEYVMNEMLQGTQILSQAQAERLEKETHRSVSQLALLGVNVAGSPEKRDENSELVLESAQVLAAFSPHSASSKHTAHFNLETPPAPSARDLPFPPGVQQTLLSLLLGSNEAEIADRMGLSRHTIHVYLKMIFHHFQVSGRTELLLRLMNTDNQPSQVAPRKP